MILSDDDLFALTETVWSSVLGLELARANDADAKIGERTTTACVQITGDWEGAVTVQCPSACAQQLAAEMFQMPIEDLSDDEVRDALGEIANMTGGTVKGIAPGTNTLAIPTVVEGDEDALKFPGTSVQNIMVAESLGHKVVVTVLAKGAKE